MEVTNKDWNSFREALIVWSNKLKPGSAKPWFSAREAVIALSKIDWSRIGKNVSGSESGGADESKLFTIVYTNESESEIDYIKSKYVLVSDVLKVPDYLYIPDGKEIPEHALSLNSLTISGETPTGIYDGVTSLFELNDVEIDSLTLSQYDGLYYDLESSLWRNGKSFIVTWGGLTQTVSGDKQFEIIHVNESLYIPDGNNLSQHKIDLTSETITGETPTGVYDNITTLAELNDVELNASTLSQYDGLYYDLETTTWYNGKAFVNTWGGLTQEISGDKQFETIHVRDNLYIPDGTNLSHHKLSLTNTTITSETPTGIGNSGNDTLSLFELLDVSIDLLGLNNYDGLYYDITESVWKAGKPFLIICDNSTQEIDGDKRFDVIRAKDKLYIPDGLPVSIHNISFTNQSIVGETPTGIGVGSTTEGVSFLHLLEDVSVDFSTISNYSGLYYDTVNSLWKSGNIFLITEGSISQTVNGNKTFDYIKVNGSLYIPDATTNSTHRISITTTEITGETPTGSGGEGGALFLTELLDVDSNNSYGADYLLCWNTNTSLWNTKDVFQLIGYTPLNEVIYTNWIGTNVTQSLTGDITGTKTYSRNDTNISINTTLARDFIYLGDSDADHKFKLSNSYIYTEIKDMSLLSSATIRANSNLYIPDGLTSSQHKISVTSTLVEGETPTAGIIVEDPSSPESSVNGWTDVYEPAGGISLGNYVVAKVDDNFNTSGALFIIDAVGSTPENSGTIIFFCSSKGSAETQNTITVLGNSMPTDPTINKLMIEWKSPYRYLKIYLKSGITKLVINCVNNNGWTTMDSYSPVSGAILSYTMNITSDSIISKRFTTT